ncbi:MAG: DUF6804 family protein [Rhodothermia bacterium]
MYDSHGGAMGFWDASDHQYRLLFAGKIGAIVMLAIALLPWPYGFYALLRWLVFPVFILAVIRSLDNEGVLWTWVFVYLLALYNPIFPIGMSRASWSILDIVSIALIGISLRKQDPRNERGTRSSRTVGSAIAGKAAVAGSNTEEAFLVLNIENRFYPHNPHPKQVEASRDLGLPLAIQHLPTCIPLVLIPGGEFVMGLAGFDDELHPTRGGDFEYVQGEDTQENMAEATKRAAQAIQRPRHTVSIRPFYMGLTPVVHFQWSVVRSPAPSHQMDRVHPVDQISWDEIQEFLSESRGCLRLPSEAEWEFAASAFTDTRYWWGNQYVLGSANLFQGEVDHKDAEETTEPGKFPANPFGLFDMIGNVEQWCQDRWHPSYVAAPSDGSAWENRHGRPWEFAYGPDWESYAYEGREADNRVVRGSGCECLVDSATCARRGCGEPSRRYLFRGFRVALDTIDLHLI